ncbi:unnamed protein product, partial [Effrenium voratum]
SRSRRGEFRLLAQLLEGLTGFAEEAPDEFPSYEKELQMNTELKASVAALHKFFNISVKAAGFDGGEEARQQEDVSHVLKSEVIEAEVGLVNPFPTSNYTIRGISAKGRRGKKEQPLFRRLPPSTAEEPARTTSEEEPAYANTTVASPEEVAESKGEGEEEAA